MFPSLQIGHLIVVKERAKVARRMLGKWIVRNQSEDVGRAFEEPRQEAVEPRRRHTERGKPHLPVEPRLMGRDEARPMIERARLVTKLVSVPGARVIRAF